MKKSIFWASVILMSIPMSVHGEVLTDEIRHTLENNPEIAVQRAKLRSATAKKGQMKSGYKPYIAVVGEAALEHRQYELTGATDEIKDDEVPYAYGIQAKMNLFEGGKTLYAVRAATFQTKAQENALKATEQKLIADTATAYLDYLDALEVQKLQKNNHNVMQAHYIETRDKVALGRGTSTDTAQAEARLQKAKALLTEAEMGLNNATERYFRITGKYPEYDKTLNIASVINKKPVTKSEKDVWSLVANVPDTLKEAEKTAEKENPSLKELFELENVASQNVKLAKNDDSASLDLSAYAGRQENQIMMENLTNYQAKLSLTVPLYDASMSHYKSVEALEQKNAVLSKIDDMRYAVREAVRVSWNALQTYKAQIDYAKAQIKANTKALNGVIDEARNGTRTTLDVLNAQQELLDSKVSLSHAEYGLIKAYVSLLQAMGTLKI